MPDPRRNPVLDTRHLYGISAASVVARGDSASDIAKGMFLSRRTVPTSISRILTRLGAKGRVEIVREVLRHGVSP